MLCRTLCTLNTLCRSRTARYARQLLCVARCLRQLFCVARCVYIVIRFVLCLVQYHLCLETRAAAACTVPVCLRHNHVHLHVHVRTGAVLVNHKFTLMSHLENYNHRCSANITFWFGGSVYIV